jgi:anti-sigma regulatory factor (Ser/Thr protein kinase)
MKVVGLLATVDIPAQASSVAVARAYVRSLLRGAGRSDAEEIALLVSELLSNAVRHSDSGRRAHGTIQLMLTDTVDALRVEVIDEGSAGTIPQIPHQVDPLSESSRGLWLVREMSSAWGWQKHPKGRVVWFECAR